jgi:hypothetical protein
VVGFLAFVQQSLHACLQLGERQPSFRRFPCDQPSGTGVPLPGGWA